MPALNEIRKTALALKKENIKGANYIVMTALSSLTNGIQKFENKTLISNIEESCTLLFQAQPTMAPLANCMALILEILEKFSKKSDEPEEIREHLLKEIEKLSLNYQSSLEKTIQNASSIIQNDTHILTYSFSSTVFKTIEYQKTLGKNLKIFITESRPNKEGFIGAQKLSQIYSTTLLIDAAIGYILSEYPIDLILIGADSFTKTELIHKIGTLPLAITAHEFKIPVYSLANSFKYYHGDACNIPISIEAKPPQEITESEVKNLEIKNYYFDRTPMKYLTGIITEEGIHDLQQGEFILKNKFPLKSLKKLYTNILE